MIFSSIHLLIILQILAVAITLLSSIGNGTFQGFSTTSAVAYINPNITTLPEIIDEEEVSWLSKDLYDLHISKCFL